MTLLCLRLIAEALLCRAKAVTSPKTMNVPASILKVIDCVRIVFIPVFLLPVYYPLTELRDRLQHFITG